MVNWQFVKKSHFLRSLNSTKKYRRRGKIKLNILVNYFMLIFSFSESEIKILFSVVFKLIFTIGKEPIASECLCFNMF